MTEKRLYFKLKVALYLIIHSWNLASDLVIGINKWAILTDKIKDDYVIFMELNKEDYFKWLENDVLIVIIGIEWNLGVICIIYKQDIISLAIVLKRRGGMINFILGGFGLLLIGIMLYWVLQPKKEWEND